MISHAPYIAAVERAFLAASFEPLNAHAEDEDPRGGAIQIDLTDPAFHTSAWDGWDEMWVSWNEDRGWALTFMQEQNSSEPRRVVLDLPVPRLASPTAVISATITVSGADAKAPADFPSVDFPGHSFEDDDPEFERALAVYRDAS